MKLRVLLADDHRLVRQGLRLLLESAPDIEVVGEAEDGCRVLERVAETRPDVVCMDINMPGLNGIAATRKLSAAHPEVKVIGLSEHGYLVMVAQMIDAGALGYVVKANARNELLPAIRLVSQQQIYLSPDFSIQDPAELVRYAGRLGKA